jgi:hypothetical protein
LAQGTSKREVAESVGCAVTTVDEVERRYSRAIEQLRIHMQAQFGHLWIAQQEARLHMYQQDIDDINDDLRASADSEEKARLMRVKHTALRQAAEELGQLPGRIAVHVESAQVTYRLEGIDIEAAFPPSVTAGHSHEGVNQRDSSDSDADEVFEAELVEE